MKKLNSKLFAGNIIPKDKLAYTLAGAWVNTCYGSSTLDRHDKDTGEPGCGDFESSSASTKKDWNWLGNGGGGILPAESVNDSFAF